MRVSWTRLLWWCCVAFPLGIVTAPGCGGRIIQAQCADAGMRYCVVTDYCCPTDRVCGTGQPNAAGEVCKIGDCCLPFDAGDEEIAPPYIDNPGVTMTGSNGPPPTGGVQAPPQPPQTRY